MAKERSDLRYALDELRSTGQTSAAVRPEIAASWHRSMAVDLQPDRLEVPYEPEPHPDDRLERAARPVLERLVEDLESTSMALLLSDRHGHIVDRLTRDRMLRARLDRIMLAPGFCYQESRIGTNAIGTALEQRAPSMVMGTEHFADALTRMACAAAPVIDPTTASLVGAIDLTCSVEGSHPLMLAMAKRSAHLIEQRLVSANPGADRALLESFLRARRGARGAALVGLNGQAMYTNAPAVKLLHDMDRALLWDLVSSALFDRQHAAFELPVPVGGSSFVSCETVADGGDVIGALLRFLPQPTATDAAAAAPDPRRSRANRGWESLTETERTVAELVSEGRTNREIAASTFLSPHTVGYHLRHIFSKLGVDSRVELTRLVVQSGR
ncbi:MAG: putative transcriptional regulator [Chloroflexi bacterium]|jgi:transcriptional regulator of acetoin/glycerol metabolism|nr:putative transcriptional regulator [Chloroflexota bacterium]